MRLTIVILVAAAALVHLAGCATASGQGETQRERYIRSIIDETIYVMDERVSPPVCYSFPSANGFSNLAIPTDCTLVRHVISVHIRHTGNVRGPSIGPDNGTGMDRQGL